MIKKIWLVCKSHVQVEMIFSRILFSLVPHAFCTGSGDISDTLLSCREHRLSDTALLVSQGEPRTAGTS